MSSYTELDRNDPSKTLKRRLQKLESQSNSSVVISIVALILALGPAIGYGIWIGMSNTNQNTLIHSNQESLSMIAQDLLMLQTQLVEAFQNSSGLEVVDTVLQTGTFSWRMYNSEMDYTEGFPATQFDASNGNMYEYRRRQIGSVNFTFLTLYPPADPLGMTGSFPPPPSTSDVLQVVMTQFDPPLLSVGILGSLGPFPVPFSNTNAAKLSITPDCTTNNDCYQLARITGPPFLDPPAGQQGMLVGNVNSNNEFERLAFSYLYYANPNTAYEFNAMTTNTMVTTTFPLDILLPIA